MINIKQHNQERSPWAALIALLRNSPSLRAAMLPYFVMMISSKIAAAVAAASVAAAMGGSGWASDIMGAGAGVAVWFGLGRFFEMILELSRNILFARVSSVAEESLSEPAFMAALCAPVGDGAFALEMAQRVEDRSARMFLGFMFNHMGGVVSDMVSMGILAVVLGAGARFMWAAPATIIVVWLGWHSSKKSKIITARFDPMGGYAAMLNQTGMLLSKAGLAKVYDSQAAYMKLRVEASEIQRQQLTAYRGSDVWIIHLSPTFAALSMAALFVLGSHGLQSELSSAAAFAAALAALGAAFSKAQQMTYAFEGLSMSLVNLDKSINALEWAKHVESQQLSKAPSAAQGTLSVAGLVANRPAMSRPAAQIDLLKVSSGQVVWLVGASGSGKSTLLGAITGTSAHDEGQILWNDLPTTSWSNLCAWVPQASMPAPGSIAWNLRLGRGQATDEEIWASLAAVKMDSRVILAGSLTVELSAMGLSGGEAQRISIARALISRRPLVLLDEPTSALDMHNQLLVVDAIEQLAKSGAAVLVSSHRLHSIPAKANIACMQDGRIVEQGILENLIATQGVFSKMWSASSGQEGNIDE